MAKSKQPKVKKCVMDTDATETDTGVWEWTAGPYVWRYDAVVRAGFNLAVARADDPGKEWTDAIYVKALDHGIMYSWGYLAGVSNTYT